MKACFFWDPPVSRALLKASDSPRDWLLQKAIPIHKLERSKDWMSFHVNVRIISSTPALRYKLSRQWMKNFVTTHNHGLFVTILACRCCGVGRINRWGGTHQTIARKRCFGRDSVLHPTGRSRFPASASHYERTEVGFLTGQELVGVCSHQLELDIWQDVLFTFAPEPRDCTAWVPQRWDATQMSFSHRLKI